MPLHNVATRIMDVVEKEKSVLVVACRGLCWPSIVSPFRSLIDQRKVLHPDGIPPLVVILSDEPAQSDSPLVVSLDGSTSSAERAQTYANATSTILVPPRLFVQDALTGSAVASTISMLVVPDCESLADYSNAVFGIHLFRKANPHGLLVCISNRPDQIKQKGIVKMTKLLQVNVVIAVQRDSQALSMDLKPSGANTNSDSLGPWPSTVVQSAGDIDALTLQLVAKLAEIRHRELFKQLFQLDTEQLIRRVVSGSPMAFHSLVVQAQINNPDWRASDSGQAIFQLSEKRAKQLPSLIYDLRSMLAEWVVQLDLNSLAHNSSTALDLDSREYSGSVNVIFVCRSRDHRTRVMTDLLTNEGSEFAIGENIRLDLEAPVRIAGEHSYLLSQGFLANMLPLPCTSVTFLASGTKPTTLMRDLVSVFSGTWDGSFTNLLVLVDSTLEGIRCVEQLGALDPELRKTTTHMLLTEMDVSALAQFQGDAARALSMSSLAEGLKQEASAFGAIKVDLSESRHDSQVFYAPHYGQHEQAVRDNEKRMTVASYSRKRTLSGLPIEPVVIADFREFRSSLPFALHLSGLRLVLKTLTVGDYVLTRDIAVERKSVPNGDFERSLGLGSLYSQLDRLSREFSWPCLLLELDRTDDLAENTATVPSLYVNRVSVASKVLPIAMHFKSLRIIWSPRVSQTAALVHRLKQGRIEPVIDREFVADHTVDASSMTSKEQRILGASKRLVGSMPGVPLSLHQGLLKQYTDMSSIFSASQASLTEVLGQRSARLLHKLFNKDLSSAV